MSAAGSELATFLGKFLDPRQYQHVASLVRVLEEEAFRKGEKWNDRQWRLGLQGGEIRFQVVPEIDVTPLRALLAHLRAFTPPVEAEPVSQPVSLPKPKAARTKPTPAPVRPTRPAPRRKPAVSSARAPRAPQKAGREATCRMCEKTFRAKAHGKLPRYCGPCNVDLHTPDKPEAPS